MQESIYQQQITCESLPFKKNKRGTYTMLLCIVFLVSACKKEKDQEKQNQLPVFGTCTSADPKGRLSFNSSTGDYTFKTSGGGTIVIGREISITHDDYVGFAINLWGKDPGVEAAYNHENLSGKHVKDKITKRRTIIFPDGAKMTLIADGIIAPVLSISIYDGTESHHVNLNCSTNTIEWSTASGTFTQELDDREADGEAGGFKFTSTGLLFEDYYVEEVAGNKVTGVVPIGELFKASPNLVVDYWP